MILSSNPKDQFAHRKVRLSLFPAAGLIGGAIALEDGARKYGPYNWRETRVVLSIYLEAIMRHLSALMDGEDVAEDSNVLHIDHIIANAAIIADARALGMLIDDRPPPGPAAAMLKHYTLPETGNTSETACS